MSAVDGLHEAAGLDKEKIVELHGNARKAVCFTCHVAVDRQLLHDKILSGEESAPVCANRDCPGVIKPTVVDFGERLSGDVQRKAAKALQSLDTCDLLLCMGTSLTVSPANLLPRLAVENGIPLVMINLSETGCDHLATLVLRSKAGPCVESILDELTRC